MAKSKHAPALFEVISGTQEVKNQGSGRFALSRWWRMGRQGKASGPESDPTGTPEEAKALPTASVAPGELKPGPAPAVMPIEPRPADRIAAMPAPPPVVSPPRVVSPPPVVSPPRVVSPPPVVSPPRVVSPPPVVSPPRVVSPPPRVSPPPTPRAGPAGGALPEVEAGPRRVFQVRAGRLEVSLNPVSAAVAAGVLLLALFTSFEVGRQFESRGTRTQAGDAGTVGDPIEEASNGPAHPEVLGVSGPTPLAGVMPPAKQGLDASAGAAPGRAAQPTGPVLEEGLNYVILARYKEADRNEALEAQKWLWEEQGFETAIHRSGRLWLLVGAQGFGAGQTAQRDECVEKIKGLSKSYKEAFRGKRVINYDFQYPEPRRYPF